MVELYNPVGLEYWLIAEPLLDEATHRGADLYSLDDVYRRIRDGEASLWLSNTHKSAAVTTWMPSSVGLILNIWLAGGDLDELKEMLISMESWGRQHGAERSLIIGRRGWGKTLDGYKDSATVFLKEL